MKKLMEVEVIALRPAYRSFDATAITRDGRLFRYSARSAIWYQIRTFCNRYENREEFSEPHDGSSAIKGRIHIKAVKR